MVIGALVSSSVRGLRMVFVVDGAEVEGGGGGEVVDVVSMVDGGEDRCGFDEKARHDVLS